MSKERFVFVRTKCRALHSLYLCFSKGIGQDITGRLAQEREYTRLIDTANAPIFGVDAEGKVNVWNKVSPATTTFTFSPSSRILPLISPLLPFVLIDSVRCV